MKRLKEKKEEFFDTIPPLSSMCYFNYILTDFYGENSCYSHPSPVRSLVILTALSLKK